MKSSFNVHQRADAAPHLRVRAVAMANLRFPFRKSAPFNVTKQSFGRANATVSFIFKAK